MPNNHLHTFIFVKNTKLCFTNLPIVFIEVKVLNTDLLQEDKSRSIYLKFS